MRSALLAAALALLAACTPRAVVPDAERERAHAALDGKLRYLRVALSVHPFFSDASKRLLLDAPAGEVDLLRGGSGEILVPPPAEKVLPPGTAVRLEEIEFPTGLLIARRVLMTPRYHPWVVLKVPGDARPYLLVLSQDSVTAAAAQAEVDRVLTADDPAPALLALPPEQRGAVLRKELVETMSLRAVEMAWGVPERRHIERSEGTEIWSWPGGKRRAWFKDDRLTRFER
jgi:hypothetical protein